MIVVMTMNDIFDCKLLIVDDEQELRRMVSEILGREGFTKVISATDCKEARQLFAQEKPEGVILDVCLPGWGRLCLAARISRYIGCSGTVSFCA